MARPKQDGLLYFSFDTDFFYADKRIKRLQSKFENDGLILYIYLLTEIYRNGYYISWDEDAAEDAAADLHLKEGFIEQVLTYLRGRSLLTMRTLSTGVTIITSPGIQKRYQEAVKSRKRDVYVDSEIWLLDENETAAYIKVTHNNYKSCGNESKSCGNESKSCGNDIKESKVKESKVNKNNMRKADALALFEHLWKLYPLKKGKGQVSDTQKMKLLKIGFDEMSRAIERYKQYVDNIDYLSYQNGSTFFNSGYVDYLDANYTKPAAKNPRNSFNSFPQREYDFEDLESELLNNLRGRAIVENGCAYGKLPTLLRERKG
jgi:hypothetical protein